MTELTDTQKLRMIPQLMEGVTELHHVIITGDIRTGQPGMMETVRSMSRDLTEIKVGQKTLAELEKRVSEIEERHKIIDAQKEDAEKRSKKLSPYQIAIFVTIITNIGVILMSLFGFGK